MLTPTAFTVTVLSPHVVIVGAVGNIHDTLHLVVLEDHVIGDSAGVELPESANGEERNRGALLPMWHTIFHGDPVFSRLDCCTYFFKGAERSLGHWKNSGHLAYGSCIFSSDASTYTSPGTIVELFELC